MIIDDDNKLVFVSTPKTGTHTMYKLLTNSPFSGYRHGGFHDTNIPDSKLEYHIFTTCRDPFERVVSAWNSILFQDKYRKEFLEKIGSDTFEDFVNWIYHTLDPNDKNTGGLCVVTPQSTWTKGVPVQTYMSIEHINDCLCLYFSDLGEIKAPHILKRPHKTYSDLRTPNTDKKLREFYKDDLKFTQGV